jgi:protoporphyrin/coproporphyrin ferrochelatase
MTGILLIQLGTPDAPTPEAVKPYLKQFLSDPRVIENQGLKWKLILNTFILRRRPKESAEKYARIWDPVTGSPLMHYTRRQTELLQARFPNTPVRFGMIVGNPSVRKVASQMVKEGIDRLVVVPMFPQYSATTTASATDSLFKTFLQERRIPAMRINTSYATHPAYLDAIEATLRDDVATLPWTPEHFVVSFHGLPQTYAKKGDSYPSEVVRTTRELVRRMGWPKDQWSQTYQSRFGRSEWLKPYTDDVLVKLAKRGIRRVYVALPGFTADCLETIDEIGRESREAFEHAGGEHLHNGRCLNDHPRWIDALERIVRDEAGGWI